MEGVVVVKLRVNDSLEERPNSIDVGHKGESSLYPIKVVQEIFGQPTIEVMHHVEASKGKQNDEEHEEYNC